MQSLVEQRILVTGASSGLGRALSVRLADAGATVVATARRRAPLDELAERHPGIKPRILDLMDAEGLANLCDTIGPLTGAVLNAGVTHVGPFIKGSDLADAAMVETNVMANVRLARALHKPLNGGRLVFVGSMAGQIPLPYQAVYSGTKAFLLNFSLALREEWRDEVSVGIFMPGGIKTEMTDIEALSKLQNMLAGADEVADDLMAFYLSDRALHIPGFVNRLSATATRLLPRPWITGIMERVYRREP
ncbi:MAG: SDR family NAD(P)-dependent oxidoreductase [Litorimonas sp.]